VGVEGFVGTRSSDCYLEYIGCCITLSGQREWTTLLERSDVRSRPVRRAVLAFGTHMAGARRSVATSWRATSLPCFF